MSPSRPPEPLRIGRRGPLFATLALFVLSLAPQNASAWSAQTELDFAERAARFAPKALQRQIDKHPAKLREGVLWAIQNPAVSKRLDQALKDEIDAAVRAIREHEPFESIVFRLGVALHYVALANDPVAVGSSNPLEGRFRQDFPVYVDSARARFNIAFYGDGRRLDDENDLNRLLSNTFARGSEYYGWLGKEYDRIHYGKGRELFDDRSTAFAVAALAYSHSISDSIGVLRYIWLRGGGADPREFLKLTPPRAAR